MVIKKRIKIISQTRFNMIYKINNKYYVKVQGYYVEVSITNKNGSLDIKPNKNKNTRIEVSKVKNAVIVNIKKENFNQNINESKNSNEDSKSKNSKKW